jgi:hypothetical protein
MQSKEEIKKQIRELEKYVENIYALVVFKKEPIIGDSFQVGKVIFEAREPKFKIVVL